MSKKTNAQEDFNKLQATLRGLTIEELLALFIEAKTGSYVDIDELPESYFEMINELGDMLNKFYADRVIDNLFN
jgi:hypothetical protein